MYFDCRHLPYCDDTSVTFNDVITFTDVNLNDGICDILYNQCISKHVRILDFHLTLGRITLVGQEFLYLGKTQNFLIWCARKGNPKFYPGKEILFPNPG